MEIRITLEAVKILNAIRRDGPVSGADVLRSTSILTGTGYPLMRRLEGVGYLAGEWEDGDPSELGRPRCRYYKITDAGRVAAEAVLVGLGV